MCSHSLTARADHLRSGGGDGLLNRLGRRPIAKDMAAYDPTLQLPEVLQPVSLTLHRASSPSLFAPTRVLDLEQRDGGSVVVVACPAGMDVGEHRYDAELAWTYPLGRVSCPVSTRSERRPYGAVWVLAPIGPNVRVQERRHFRAQMAVPLRLSWEVRPTASDECEQHRLDGVTVDVSEGGVLALLHGDPPLVGLDVEATMRLDGDEVHGPATVVRHIPFPGGTGVGVMFREPNGNADALRRAAFDSERRRARAAR